MEQNSGAGRSSGARLEDGTQGTPSSLLRPSNGSEFQPSQNTGSSMAKLPSKGGLALPQHWLKMYREHPPATGAAASACSRQGARSRLPTKTFLTLQSSVPRSFSRGPPAPGDSGGMSKGVPAAANPRACFFRIPSECISLQADSPGWCETVCPHCSNGHCISGQAGGWGQRRDLCAVSAGATHPERDRCSN